jgi:hypothetical protein
VTTATMSPELLGFHARLRDWRNNPVHFVERVLGGTPDPWQCDVMDALQEFDQVAVRSCHGVGKTTLICWLVLHFAMLHQYSKCIITAPTYERQVEKVVFSEMHKWFRHATKASPKLTAGWEFAAGVFRFAPAREEWFAMGVPSNNPLNVEGFHAQDFLAVIDEAKGVAPPVWASLAGMLTTEAKIFAASTPGYPGGDFFKIFTQFRSTWRSTFVVHPSLLRETFIPPRPAVEERNKPGQPRPFVRSPEDCLARKHQLAGSERTYYSDRPPQKFIDNIADAYGRDSGIFASKVVGDFPNVAGDVLVPYHLIEMARTRTKGIEGPTWVACDVAMYGLDRTVALVAQGGTIVDGESIAKDPTKTTDQAIVQEFGVGFDPKRPAYRSVDATADLCVRLALKWGAQGVIIDDSGLGGHVTDAIRKRGVVAVPFYFGVPPSDIPKSPDALRARKLANKVPSNFANQKAQAAWALRGGFESGAISLAALKPSVRDPLISQLSMVKIQFTEKMLMRIVDPDEDDLMEALLGERGEQRRSPDHFHALVMAWWRAGTAAGLVTPAARAIIPGRIPTAGKRPHVSPSQAAQPNQVAGAAMGIIGRGSQAHYLNGLWRSGR